MLKAIRQGDVLLVRLDHLPKGARCRDEAVARIPGENGHAHNLSGAALYELNRRAIALVPPGKTAVLNHEEHPSVFVPEGIWEIRTPHTYNWPRWIPREEEAGTKVNIPAAKSHQLESRVPYAD